MNQGFYLFRGGYLNHITSIKGISTHSSYRSKVGYHACAEGDNMISLKLLMYT